MIDGSLQSVLESVAETRVLLVASDYDGTLSPIVNNPAAATPDEQALATLVRIGRLQDTLAVIVSGRSLDTLRRLTGAPPGVTLIGSHGAEAAVQTVDAALAARASTLGQDMNRLAARHRGAEVELKPSGVAFHYRNASEGSEAVAEARALGRAAGARAMEGKMVVEFVFADTDKGAAIEDFRTRSGATAVVFIGDDVTDEHVFATLEVGDVGIKVGPGHSRARFRVPVQPDVGDVLLVLESARQANDLLE
ncbi:MAG: trehalose-phosphatase [Actinomycetota bacterium]|nr:trehalose-phosphatase [Actinomycetota bacterium]